MLTIINRAWASLDLSGFNRAGSRTIVVVSAMHLYQMSLMARWDNAADATCLRALFDILRLVVPEDGVEYIYAFVFGAVALALIGTFSRLGWARLAILIPQQLVLAGMAWGGLIATFMGHYLDGTVIPRAHISADQIGYVALCVLHLDAIIRRARDPNG